MHITLKLLKMDVWLLEQLKHAEQPGLTLEELQSRWKSNPHNEGLLGRTTMTRHRKLIEEEEETVTFQFHISPTPDFLGELNRWGVEPKA